MARQNRTYRALGQDALEKISFRTLEIGQVVTDRAMRAACGKFFPNRQLAQEMKPCGRRIDNGNIRTTHHTFRRINWYVWQYCGECFIGDTEEKGISFQEYARLRKEEKKNGRNKDS